LLNQYRDKNNKKRIERYRTDLRRLAQARRSGIAIRSNGGGCFQWLLANGGKAAARIQIL
jgi:hypothetical protein